MVIKSVGALLSYMRLHPDAILQDTQYETSAKSVHPFRYVLKENDIITHVDGRSVRAIFHRVDHVDGGWRLREI